MMAQVQATVVLAQRLNATIWKYRLQPEQAVAYQAGQYLQVHRGDQGYYYSMTNAPSEGSYYELHIRHVDDDQPWALQQSLTLSLPYGHCYLDQLTDKPILFLAAGTGFAPIRAMIEDLQERADPRRLELYWGVAQEDDLYDNKSVQCWKKTHPGFQYFAHIAQSHQPGLTSLVLAQHPHDLQDWQVVMAGPFEYMYRMRDEFLAQGLAPQSIVSDAFEFSVR